MGPEASKIALLVHHTNRVYEELTMGSPNARVAAAVEVPNIIRSLVEQFNIYAHMVLEEQPAPDAASTNGLPAVLLLLISQNTGTGTKRAA